MRHEPVRYHALDSLRASMMLLGIYLHVSCAYSNIPDTWWYSDPRSKNVLFDLSLAVIHIFRMPLFMVMAGFFAALLCERRGEWGLLRNRLLRIGVPLVAGVPLLFPVLVFLQRLGRYWNEPEGVARAWAVVASFDWLRWMDPTHLWFLEYLLLLCFTTLLIRSAFRAIPADRWFDRTWRSVWLRYLVWPVLTFATLSVSEIGLLDTPHSWIPVIRIAVAYQVFFGFGWLLWRERGSLEEQLIPHAWSATAAAMGVSALCAWLALMNLGRMAAGAPDETLRLLTAATAALATWCWIFGLTGVYLRCLNRESRTWRYLSDASYWMYIMHSPVVLAFHIALGLTALPALVKCGIAVMGSAVVLLVSYQWLVRRTWVGVLLNGKRHMPAAARAELTAAA